jgi:hypothetical protein
MKRKLITLAFLLIASYSFTQSNSTVQECVSENCVYKLFPTQNYWTFIKLDTRNGKMWQVHFSVEEGVANGEVVLNSESLVSITEESNGRFTLYPTENIYNFLLLDQKIGLVYQVQWSMDKNYRGIVLIN